MGIIEKILKMSSRQDDNDDKVIDLSDSSQYPPVLPFNYGHSA
jgi:hypothetical protein